MINLDRDLQLNLMAETGRAPSAHNTQPARWRILPDARVMLFEDTRTRLVIGDPDGRDSRVALGAAFEGLQIALSRRGLGLTALELTGSEDTSVELPHLVKVAEAKLREDSRVDPLADQVFRRRTYRGRFAPSEDDDVGRLRQRLHADDNVCLVYEKDEIDEIARLHDTCTWFFLKDAAYHAELYDWMRFSTTHPGWDRDGLTSDCMGLSHLERRLVPWCFSPFGFRTLKALGLARRVISEAPAVRSASLLVILYSGADEDLFHAGRRFYRLWLEICAEQFHLCPMSTTACAPMGVDRLKRGWPLPAGSQVINLFRIGTAPAGSVGESRRLPAEELLV